MRAHFGLPSVTAEEPEHWRAPIEVQFEIPYFTVSGIQVRYLKIIEKSGYQVSLELDVLLCGKYISIGRT